MLQSSKQCALVVTMIAAAPERLALMQLTKSGQLLASVTVHAQKLLRSTTMTLLWMLFVARGSTSKQLVSE